MRLPKLMIGLPCYGGVHPMFMMSMIHLLRAVGDMNPTVHIVRGDSLVARARNKITAAFMASDCDTLLQIDTDLEFSAQRMREMLLRDLPIVGGCYPHKRLDKVMWVANGLSGAETDETGKQEVRLLGTGMLAVQRQVFEHLIDEGKVSEYIPDDDEKAGAYHDFWPCRPMLDAQANRVRYMSEDWGFCHLARDAGWKIYADTLNVARHYGEIGYPTSTQLAEQKPGEVS